MHSVSYLYFVCLVLVLEETKAQTFLNTVRIAGFFDAYQDDARKAFMWTFQKLNLGRDLLMAPNPHSLDSTDSFKVSKRVCKEIEEGAKAVFGPNSRDSSAHVQTISNTLGIPHIEFQNGVDDTVAPSIGPTASPAKSDMSLNMYPSHDRINMAHIDWIRKLNWKAFTIIYDSLEGLLRLQDVLLESDAEDVDISIRVLADDPAEYGKMFKSMKDGNEHRMVVDCHIDKIGAFLDKANETKLMDIYSHFHFTTLDLRLVDLDRFKTSGANITAFRIVSDQNSVVRRVLGDWKYELFKSQNNLSPLSRNRDFISTEVAMVYDGVYLFDQALDNLRKAVNVDFDQRLSCNRTESWEDGTSLFNYMKTVEFPGMTGYVQFGMNGLRTDFSMEIVRFGRNGMETIGLWNSTLASYEERINVTKTYEDPLILLENKTLRIVTKTDDPYVFDTERNPDGSIKYTGFVIDILDLVSERMKFKYKIYKNAKEYGSCQGPRKCTGMMKELVDHEADIAAAGMTITSERDDYVDFTKPFKNLGITILIKKPTEETPNLFSFLQPFHPNVWMFMVAGFICVTIMLFLSARLSPYEWNPPEGCEEDSGLVTNQFSISNSIWFTIGCILQQGSDLSPLATSTRAIAVVWWFFTLIMISSYTANLAAFLTVSRLGAPIRSIEDLAKQTEIEYGTLQSGSTHDFFQFSKELSTTYARVWNFMKQTPGVLVGSSMDGIQKVQDEKYAFFAESTSVEYHVARKCNLMQVGGELNSIGYGFALPEDSPFLKNISLAILQLNEEQKIEKLYTKWWKGTCVEEKKEEDNALKMENVAGVFVVLIGGCCIALLIAACEFLWKASKNAKNDQQSLCSEVTEELTYIIPCLAKKSYEEEEEREDSIPENSLLTPL